MNRVLRFGLAPRSVPGHSAAPHLKVTEATYLEADSDLYNIYASLDRATCYDFVTWKWTLLEPEKSVVI